MALTVEGWLIKINELNKLDIRISWKGVIV